MSRIKFDQRFGVCLLVVCGLALITKLDLLVSNHFGNWVWVCLIVFGFSAWLFDNPVTNREPLEKRLKQTAQVFNLISLLLFLYAGLAFYLADQEIAGDHWGRWALSMLSASIVATAFSTATFLIVSLWQHKRRYEGNKIKVEGNKIKVSGAKK